MEISAQLTPATFWSQLGYPSAYEFISCVLDDDVEFDGSLYAKAFLYVDSLGLDLDEVISGALNVALDLIVDEIERAEYKAEAAR
jgi:hypothetical protein